MGYQAPADYYVTPDPTAAPEYHPPPQYQLPYGGPPPANAQEWRPDLVGGTAAPVRPTKRQRTVGVLFAAGILLVALILVAWSDVRTSTVTVTGGFTLYDSDTVAASCIGQLGYSDISAGTSVVLTNETGRILGSTNLGTGVGSSLVGTCTYTFAISDVPSDQSQYALEVSYRGKVIESKAELEGRGWTFATSLGQ